MIKLTTLIKMRAIRIPQDGGNSLLLHVSTFHHLVDYFDTSDVPILPTIIDCNFLHC